MSEEEAIFKLEPPEGLSEREVAAYRLGALEMVMSTITAEMLAYQPTATLVEAFQAEVEYRRNQLARTPDEQEDLAGMMTEADRILEFLATTEPGD